MALTSADLIEATSLAVPLKTKANDQKGPTALEAISKGPTLPGIPSYTSVETQRHVTLEHMAGAFRVFARKGFTEGLAGHISVRDPENPHTFWINPLGRHFGLLRVSDMILVNEAGEAVGGNISYPANAAGFLIHSAIHRARPDVNAACHMHSTYGKAWSAFARPLEMINQDVANFYGRAQAVYDDFGGVVLEETESAKLAEALGQEGKGLIMRNHGLLTVGSTVDEAAYLFCMMEQSCKIQLQVEAASAAGTLQKRYMTDESAQYTFRMTSDPESLYCEFQPDLEFEMEMTGAAFTK